MPIKGLVKGHKCDLWEGSWDASYKSEKRERGNPKSVRSKPSLGMIEFHPWCGDSG